jgi:hypothetical protein
VQCKMLQHASKSQPRARLGGQEKKGKKVGSFSAFLSSWGSPWSVSRQEPKEAFLAFRGGDGRWFWLGSGCLGVWRLGVWNHYAGDAATRRLRRAQSHRKLKAIVAQIRSVVMKSDPDFFLPSLSRSPSPSPHLLFHLCAPFVAAYGGYPSI